MEPHVPDVEIFIVFKWMVVLLIGAGLAQLASLLVKRWWYGEAKHDRRNDTDESRGWITRFLEIQRENNRSNLEIAEKMQKILEALQQNGKAIHDFISEAKCKYEKHGR